eukprot:12199100-Karenia_brevis.AAC.1
MQIHSHEPNVRSMHYQLQVEHQGDGTLKYKGGMNDVEHEHSIFDEFHEVHVPRPDFLREGCGTLYSALDEVSGRKNQTR